MQDKINKLYEEWAEISGREKWLFGSGGLIISGIGGFLLGSIILDKPKSWELAFELSLSSIFLLMGGAIMSMALYFAYREYKIPQELVALGEASEAIPGKLKDVRKKNAEEYEQLHANDEINYVFPF